MPQRPTAVVPPDPREPWYRIQAAAGSNKAEIWIYDDIGWLGTSAKRFAEDLRVVEAAEITLHLNSPGGDAWDGIAIYNSLRDHKATVTVVVDGMAASAASLIAMAGDTVRMNVGAQMMIHDAHGLVIGTAADMRDLAAALDKTNASMAAVYAGKAGGTVEEWRTVMRAETWYTAAEAVDAGLADEVVDGAAAQPKASWDLTSRFRYAGREQAPAPSVRLGRLTTPAQAARRIHAASLTTPAANPAAGPSDTTEGAAEMQFTDEERAVLRARFTLPADADDDAIKAALLAPATETTSSDNGSTGPTSPPAASSTPGTMTVDVSAWQEREERLRRLEVQAAQQRRDERDQVIEQAVKDGKFAPARREHWAKLWDSNPDGTRQVIEGLTKGVVPTAEMGYAVGGDEEDIDGEFRGMFPPGFFQTTGA